jgi:hypothetical protein
MLICASNDPSSISGSFFSSSLSVVRNRAVHIKKKKERDRFGIMGYHFLLVLTPVSTINNLHDYYCSEAMEQSLVNLFHFVHKCGVIFERTELSCWAIYRA